MRGRPFIELLCVGLGGFAGASLRYGLAGWVHRLAPGGVFPWGTLVVNLAGCLGIGLLAGLVDGRGLLGPAARLFLLIGLLGGFTTFSTFAYETVALARGAELLRAAANVAAQVVFGLALAWAAYSLARSW